ncbi:MAG: hypothetical protein JSW66_01570 [Phycisphaerales bacterium]|nr:MAG: hypothetical protein JSW66_01570 [Phycisphaerales bacterium]
MKRTVVSLVVLWLVLAPADARRFVDGPVRLTVYPAIAPEPGDKIVLLAKTDEQSDADAAPLYERAVQSMPRGIKQDQMREWLKLPPEELPQQQAEEMVQKYLESLKLVFQATKCKQCNWPEWKPGDQLPSFNEYRELAFVIQLWARLEISRGGYDGALLAMQAGFAMGRHLGEGPTILQTLVGATVGGLMCREIEQFVQSQDAPNLYGALKDMPEPLINVERAIENERANLNDQNALVRKEREEQLKPALDRIRMNIRRLDNHLNALQVVEAIRHYAATHDGQLPQVLGDIQDIEVPNDLMSGQAFIYGRMSSGATLQSAIPEGGNERDTVHYEIVLKK